MSRHGETKLIVVQTFLEFLQVLVFSMRVILYVVYNVLSRGSCVYLMIEAIAFH